MATFTVGEFTVSLVNVHLYFGSDSTRSKNRRRLETYVVARWADLRRRSRHAVTTDVVALGDFNLPKAVRGDPVFTTPQNSRDGAATPAAREQPVRSARRSLLPLGTR